MIALFSVIQTSGVFKLNYATAVIVAVIALLFIKRNSYEFFSRQKINNLIILFIVGSGGYAFTIMIMYLFCFEYWEMAGLASFTRYMSSYLLSEYIILTYIFAEIIANRIDKDENCKGIKVIKYLLILIGIGLVCTDNEKMEYLIPQVLKGDSYQSMENSAKYIENATSKGSRICVLSDDSISTDIAIFNYYISDRNWDMRYRDYNIEPFIFAEDSSKLKVLEFIREDDYLYISDTTEEIQEFLNDYFDSCVASSNTLYRIETYDTTIRLTVVEK